MIDKLVFSALVDAVRNKHGSTRPMPRSVEVELGAVWKWATDTKASVERVKEEIEWTLDDVRGSKTQIRQRGVNRVEIEYHGAPRND